MQGYGTRRGAVDLASPQFQLSALFHTRVAISSQRGLESCAAAAEDGRSQPTQEVTVYSAMGYVHASLLAALARLRRQGGQGTVEYVALILLVALVMAGVVAAMKGFRTDQGKELGEVILGKIKDAVRKVQF